MSGLDEGRRKRKGKGLVRNPSQGASETECQVEDSQTR